MKKSNKSSRNRPKIIMRVIWKWKVITKFWQVDRIKRSILFIVNLGKYCIASSTLHRVVYTFWCKRCSTQEIFFKKMLYGNLIIVINQWFEVSNYSSIYLSYLISTNSMTTSKLLAFDRINQIRDFFCIVEVSTFETFFNFYSMKQQYSIKSILCPGMWPWNFIRKRMENLTK